MFYGESHEELLNFDEYHNEDLVWSGETCGQVLELC